MVQRKNALDFRPKLLFAEFGRNRGECHSGPRSDQSGRMNDAVQRPEFLKRKLHCTFYLIWISNVGADNPDRSFAALDFQQAAYLFTNFLIRAGSQEMLPLPSFWEGRPAEQHQFCLELFRQMPGQG